VAWEACWTPLGPARKTRTRQEGALPPRSGARWYEGEDGELVASFKAGRSIPQLARAHNRTEFAVEAQLERLGLWNRVERRPKNGQASIPASAPVSTPAGTDDHPPFPGGPGRD
jgi:hypothetical protein